MTEEEISSTGQFNAIGTADTVASYQPSVDKSSQLANSTSAPIPGISTTQYPSAQHPIAPPTAAAATASSTTPGKPPTAQEIAAAIATANANLASSSRELDYRVDAATGISIALIRNSQTGVVVQQMPGADIIALARMLANWAPGKHMMLDLIA